jgi:hypothetical protein
VERINAAPLFGSVGAPLDDPAVVRASGWRAAAKSALSKAWYNARIDARNAITETLCSHYGKRYQTWNDVVHTARPLFMPAVDAALARLRPAVGLGERAWREFETSVRVDFLGACTEADFGDVCPARFHQDLMAWYFRGHFPCGQAAGPAAPLTVY